MRRLSEILASFAARQAKPFSAVSLLDEIWDPAQHAQPVQYNSFRGARGSRIRFTRDLFRTAAECRNQTLVLGHVALAPLGLALLRLKMIRSYVVVLHGIEAWRRLRSRERVACYSARAITATTRYTQELFAQENGLRADQVTVLPLSIERSILTAPTHAERSISQDLRVLFVGRLWSRERYKGADELIEAVSLLRPRLRVLLEFVGTGDDVPRLREKVRLLALDDSVIFRGGLNDQKLQAAYQNCDLFALPSSGEGFGIAFLEAMSHGRPCLGARCGGIPEVIDEGVNGFLVRPNDPSEIAACFERCSSEPKLLREMGRKGFEKVANQYLLDNMMRNWQTLLADKDCA